MAPLKTNATNPLHQSTKVKPGNKYVNNYGWMPRQKLAEDLIIQAIKMAGMYVRYIPREIFNRDPLFGDDNWAEFNYFFEIECILKNVDAYEGQNEFWGKFEMEIRDQATFTIARRRWFDCSSEKILDENGLPLEGEEDPGWTPNYSPTSGIKEEANSPHHPNVQYALPRAGDLIYFPMVNKIFEITFVEHETLFYQHGTLLTYDLKCELFRYSNETIDTGNIFDDMEQLVNNVSNDQESFAFLDEEDGEKITEEDGDTSILGEESSKIETKDPQADNSLLQKEGEKLIDYSDQSPFIRKNRY